VVHLDASTHFMPSITFIARSDRGDAAFAIKARRGKARSISCGARGEAWRRALGCSDLLLQSRRDGTWCRSLDELQLGPRGTQTSTDAVFGEAPVERVGEDVYGESNGMRSA
jgi:hypothetical protein